MSDPIRPAHYGGADNPFETIKVLEAWLTREELIGFCRGNAIKYLSRAGKKGSAAEDARKAAWCAGKMAELLDEAATVREDPDVRLVPRKAG